MTTPIEDKKCCEECRWNERKSRFARTPCLQCSCHHKICCSDCAELKKGHGCIKCGCHSGHNPQKDIEGWEDWVRTLANSSNPKDADLLIAKIHVLLKQERERVERVIDGMILNGREMPGFTGEVSTTRIEGYNRALTELRAKLKNE